MRTKLQQYATIGAIIAENVIVNQNNDMVYAEDEKAIFCWIETSTATDDSKYVLKETRTAGAGRWHKQITASGIYSGTANSTAIPNGNSVSVDVTVTGASLSTFGSVSVTNSAALNTAGLDVVSASIVSADTVRVVLYNPSGDDVAALAVDASVLQF